MDRTALFACALFMAPVALATGCGSKQPAAPADTAPLVLAELQEWSPGPWRRAAGEVAPTSLERPAYDFGSAASGDRATLDELHARMRGPQVEPPLDNEPIDAAPVPAPRVASESQPTALEPGSPADVPPLPAAESPLPEVAPELIDPAVPAEAEPADPPAAEARSGVPRTLEGMLAPPEAPGQSLPLAAPMVAERTQLPWAAAAVPSPEMQAVLEQAEIRLREGFRLAERGALRLARAEFVAALELIAEANDTQRGTQFHSQSLAAGLVALEESRDFTRPKPIGKSLDLERIVSGHRTKILAAAELAGLSPAPAARRYYAFAQEQLAGATAGEPRCSIALYGLGRLAFAGQQEEPARRLEFTAQAMVLYQAALMSDRSNYRAANELGVILAKNGHLPQAKKLFVHSVKLSPHPSTFRNLGIVHARLGEAQLAKHATDRALEMERSGFRRSGPAVQWVDPLTFAGTTPPSTDVMPPVAQKGTAPAGDPKQPPAATADKESSGWFPWKTRR